MNPFVVVIELQHWLKTLLELHGCQPQPLDWSGLALQRHMGRNPKPCLWQASWNTNLARCYCNEPESLKDPSCPETNKVTHFVPQGHSHGQCNSLTHALQYNRLSNSLALFGSGTRLSNQLYMCGTRQHCVATSRRKYKCLTQTTSRARFCAKTTKIARIPSF